MILSFSKERIAYYRLDETLLDISTVWVLSEFLWLYTNNVEKIWRAIIVPSFSCYIFPRIV